MNDLEKIMRLHLATPDAEYDAWKQFFRLCREYAQIARQRRQEQLIEMEGAAERSSAEEEAE
ncbi:MAG TPA: hypothetical protein VKU00_29455 [Chthonomonadaceae bacterium]|nr:hypothetical protein [Chthonomonadaceae bacterium]